jgi:hypothetical protein
VRHGLAYGQVCEQIMCEISTQIAKKQQELLPSKKVHRRFALWSKFDRFACRLSIWGGAAC